ncbi:hypothetical protein CW731_04520 [Polaribacter sp. ALD11]|uniref:helix-turn-helix domain-containing protein n=1 Tax=Polaribacter sp. ALD11 TaxID=2058137 RepID=UPI000C309498|nr:AraC family transcriptional regulator [Polaribacter sp. ALD11]AUC84610.1 hypothetical protein CW731_04520 [Polaribacter sp. ALD11]
MISSILIENNREIVFDKTSEIIKIDECGTHEVVTLINDKSWYKEQVFDSFKIGYGTLIDVKNNKIKFDFKGETIGMVFIQKGSLSINIPKLSHTNYLESNEHNLFYYTSISGEIEMTDDIVSIFRINFSLSFFNQFLPDENKFKDFRKQICYNKTGKLKNKNGAITSKIFLIIDEIRNSKWKGFYRKIHMNSLILELLLLQLDQFNSSNQTRTSEEEKIIRVKDYITKNCTKSMTLNFLSKKFGTNECALKKGFKTQFGITVFGYIIDLKMDKAKELLFDKKLPVGEVSELVGYKNPQHFSTAFKKKYGVTPSKFMKFNS